MCLKVTAHFSSASNWRYRSAFSDVSAILCVSRLKTSPTEDAALAELDGELRLVSKTVARAALEIALAVQDEIARRIEQADALRRTQLERAK